MTLSDRIGEWGYNDDGTPDEDVIPATDVKQFINDIIAFLEYHKNTLLNASTIRDIIQEKAGEELCSEKEVQDSK